MNQDETLHEILFATITDAMARDLAKDAEARAVNAAKAFKAGLVEYSTEPGHVAACANTGDATTCGCQTATETC